MKREENTSLDKTTDLGTTEMQGLREEFSFTKM